MIFNLTTQ